MYLALLRYRKPKYKKNTSRNSSIRFSMRQFLISPCYSIFSNFAKSREDICTFAIEREGGGGSQVWILSWIAGGPYQFHSIYQTGFPNKYFGLDATNNPQKSISGETTTVYVMFKVNCEAKITYGGYFNVGKFLFTTFSQKSQIQKLYSRKF